MIQPVNQNLNVNSANGLKPVEVPHFTGITKIKQNNGDSFKKAAVNSGAKPQGFKHNAQKTLNAAGEGALEGVRVIQTAAKKGAEFTGAFAKSVYEDLTQIIREKGTQTISNIDSLV